MRSVQWYQISLSQFPSQAALTKVVNILKKGIKKNYVVEISTGQFLMGGWSTIIDSESRSDICLATFPETISKRPLSVTIAS